MPACNLPHGHAQAEPRPKAALYKCKTIISSRKGRRFGSVAAAPNFRMPLIAQGIAAQHRSSPKENPLSAASLRRYFRERSLGLPSGSTTSLRGVLGLRPLPLPPLPSTALSWAASGVPHGLGASASATICTKHASHWNRGLRGFGCSARRRHGLPLRPTCAGPCNSPRICIERARHNGLQCPSQLSPAQRCPSV